VNARRHLIGIAAVVSVLVVGTMPATATAGPRSDDPGQVADTRLRDDASGRVTVERTASGRVRFVGTAGHGEVDNPAVDGQDSVRAAARAHLDRYGAALGAAPGTRFVQRPAERATSGVDLVRFQQEVDGVPVLGGDVVLGLGPDRDLRSLSADVAREARVTPPSVDAKQSASAALELVGRRHRRADLTVTDQGRWVLDPVVAGLRLPGGVRSVRRLEVGDGAGVRELVLVDDHSGAVVLHVSLIEHVDRVVCDRNNVRGADTSCTTGFVRTEGGVASAVSDVNAAYDLSGAVSDFYGSVAGLDLTQLLGVDVGGAPKLASTVRFCTTDLADTCPYANAFWNGAQMFYGTGWAGADDVVGHEMTHGVVDQYSKLFYWGQSGAINESMADIIGEIIDHRHPSAGDAANNWDLGEDSPVGTIRNLANPTTYGQPDRTTSNLYTADAGYGDAGGVHTNSGVGNKTAYLISQGGTFNGQTITGIDGADAALTKTARLYVDVIERLSSGADYADLGSQLDQSCQDLLAAAVPGFTAADCTAVHKATVATELATAPTQAAPPTDAPTTCPAGTTKRVLLDSESSPASKFAPFSTGWSRESAAGTSNATSGTDSWFALDPGGSSPSSASIQTNPLRSSSSIALPAGQQSFLSFANWYVLDYDANGYYDGGTVEVGVDGGVPMFGSTNGKPWVNGPNHVLASGSGNTAAGQPAFTGDSRGWSVSRLDLSTFAGHAVQPQFTMRSDNQFGFIGWYLDDIEIYTCDPAPAPAPPSAPRSMKVYGGVNSVTITWSPPAVNASQVDHYLVEVEATGIVVPATRTSLYVPVVTHYLSGLVPRVAAVSKGGDVVWGPSVTVPHPRPTLEAKRSGARLRFKGRLATGPYLDVPIVDAAIKLQRRTSSGWVNVKSARTGSDGRYVIRIKHRKRAKYRAVSVGRLWLIGHVSTARRW
jgi:Zn-dependent metalloprotease